MTILHRQKFLLPCGSPLPTEYDIVWSPRVGFAYADTPADQDVYDQYYEQFSKYEDSASSTGGAGSASDATRLANTAADIEQVLPDREAHVLDIGCANGGLLMALQRLGYKSLNGVDPSRACVNTVRSAVGVSAEVGGLFNLPPQLKPPNIVILSQVLEHIHDLRRAVEVLHALLPHEGIVYCEVPDAKRYCEYVFAPFQDFNTEHINHFSSISLGNLFHSVGFETVTAGTRTIYTSPKCPYPVVFGFFRKSTTRHLGSGFQPDDACFDRLKDYVAISSRKLASIESVIDPLVRSQVPLVIWGAGQLTMKLLAETSLAGANIMAIVDANPINQGKMLLNHMICAPGKVASLDPCAPILIGTLLHQDAIRSMIKTKLCLSNKVIVLEQ